MTTRRILYFVFVLIVLSLSACAPAANPSKSNPSQANVKAAVKIEDKKPIVQPETFKKYETGNMALIGSLDLEDELFEAMTVQLNEGATWDKTEEKRYLSTITYQLTEEQRLYQIVYRPAKDGGIDLKIEVWGSDGRIGTFRYYLWKDGKLTESQKWEDGV